MSEITDDHQHSALLSEAEKAALAWADELLAGGREPSPELANRLRVAFSTEQLVELTYAMGCFIGYSKQLIVLGLEPAEPQLAVVPTPG